MRRSASTISRELKRNGYTVVGGRRMYRPYMAYNRYLRRRLKCRRGKIFDDQTLWDKVVKHITQDQWSPEQISNRLKMENSPFQVSYTTIYRALRVADYETESVLKQAKTSHFICVIAERSGAKMDVLTIADIFQSCIIFPNDVRLQRIAKRSGIGKQTRS